jgi:hypothetical protein
MRLKEIPMLFWGPQWFAMFRGKFFGKCRRDA